MKRFALFLRESTDYWKTTPWGWTTLFAGQRCSVRWVRASDGSRVYVPRVNGSAEQSPARAYISLKAARAAAEEYAMRIGQITKG